MGSEYNQSKRHYDLSMSKRTRKPIKLETTDRQTTTTRENPLTGVNEHEDVTYHGSWKEPMKLGEPDRRAITTGSPEREISPSGVDEEDVIDHRSLKLKELINGEGEVKLIDEGGEANSGQEKRGGNSLGHHFTEEEKQLQLVTKQQAEHLEGVKTSGMVSRYIKVLSNLIKVKRDPRLGSRKKPILRLTT